MWWSSGWVHVGSPPRPGLRTICGEGGGSSGCNHRGFCLVSGWVCQSIKSDTPHPQKARPRPWTVTEPPPHWSYWWMQQADVREAELPAVMPVRLHRAEASDQVPLVVVRASNSPHSLFLTVWADACTRGACWRSVFMVPPVSLCTQEPMCSLSAAMLLTSLSTWHDIAI